MHLNAIARHLGLELSAEVWQTVGYAIPLLVDLQPAGRFLGEDFHHAGGVPAVLGELIKADLLPHPGALTVTGRSIGENCASAQVMDGEVIRSAAHPMKSAAGFINLTGNLFDNAFMKTSVISAAFRARYLSNPADPEAFVARAIVFEGPEDYHHRIDDPTLNIDANCILVIRGTGPIGYPGSAEVVNMQPPAALIKQGITDLPCLGDGRQSGTSASPSILNASPEAAVMGGLAIVATGDMIRIDLRARRADLQLDAGVIAARRAALEATGGFPIPPHQTPWQEIQRSMVAQLDEGMVLKPAVKYQRIAQTKGLPRDSH